jgi:hypothetical protein
MSLCSRKRKRIPCVRCCGEEEWSGEKWEERVKSFHDLGMKTSSKMQLWRKTPNRHLTTHQKQALLSLFYNDDGVCSLCVKCFTLFTGESEFVRKSLSKLLREKVDRADVLLNFDLLSSGHLKNTNHSYSSTVLSCIKIFCMKENVFHWNPCKYSLIFNVDVNSWKAQWEAYAKYCSENGFLFPVPSRKTYTKIVRSIFNGIPIGCLAKMKDACDVCVRYWKEKKTFSQSLARQSGTTPKDTEHCESVKKFIDCHALWHAHVEFAYHERNYYKGNYLLARKEYSLLQKEERLGELETLHLSVDAMKIQYLPHFVYPESHSLYFLNKLKMYVLGIVNESKEMSILYTWDSTNGPTATNHVLTAIWSYLQSERTNEKTLRITMDNCGVNKAYLFTSFAVALVTLAYFSKVELDWLVVGHTKFSPDRLFGLTSRVLQKNEYASLGNVKDLITKNIPKSGNEILASIIDFSSTLNSYFRSQKFLSKDGPIGIQSIQGFRVESVEDRSVKTTAIFRHSYTKDQVEILANKAAQKNAMPTPINPLESKVDHLIRNWVPPQTPPGREIEVCTIKKNVSLTNLQWPTIENDWKKLPIRGIEAGLLLDLWTACELTVNDLTTDYHGLAENLSKDEIKHLKKNPKLLLDVRGGVQGVRQNILEDMGGPEILRQEKREEEEEKEEDHGEKDMEEQGEREAEKGVPENAVIAEAKRPQKNYCWLPDEELKMSEEEEEVLRSLAFEFSMIVEEATNSAAKPQQERPTRERKKKVLKDFVTP